MATVDPREIGRRIKKAREQKGWTQLRFALDANVSPSTVTRWEAGKLPPVRELMRIAELLEVEPDYLVESGGDEATPSSDETLRAEFLQALQAERAQVAEMIAENQQHMDREFRALRSLLEGLRRDASAGGQ